MKFSTKTSAPQSTASACLVLGVFENGLPPLTEEVDKAAEGRLSRKVKQGDIGGKPGQYLLLHDVPGIQAERVLLVGLGKKNELQAKKFVAALQHAAKALHKYHIADILLGLAALEVEGLDMERKARLAAQNFAAADYRYSRTKSKPAPAAKLKSVDLHLSDKKEQAAAKRGLEVGRAVAAGMAVARELGNLPGNICTPTYLAEQAEDLARSAKNLKTRVLSEAQMKRLGMGSLLSVSAGSEQPAKLIIMEYSGAGNARPHVLVGKGITFDTGGISIKPGAGMDEMKFDMCGAASVLGTMTALCELQPKINVVGMIPAAENMPGGSATKPGDIVTSMSGQTIEILNTDAEGRLVLCDALTYAERFKPQSVIDIATLTGACVVALGAHTSGLMSNDDALAERLYDCGQNALDPVWRLPIWDEYQKQLHSNFADIANIGGPKAGTITAACFLSRFTKKYKWAHLDIAGTAWLQGDQKGATGRPVPLLMEYLLSA